MSKVIAAEDLAEYQRWTVPEVAASGNRLLTAQALERLQKQAYEEAYARGYQEALAAGRAQIQAQAKRMTQLIDTLAEPLKVLDDEVERELTALALVIARHVVRREIKLDPGQVMAVIREAVGSLPLAARSVRVHLHPDDATLVRGFLSQDGEPHAWKLVDDPAITRGGCKIVTETSSIDATLEQRLGAIAAQVLGGERESDGSERG